MKRQYTFFRLALTVVGLIVSQVVIAQCPAITCPGNITVNNDPGTCGGTVTFTAPIGTNPCGLPVTQTFVYTGAVQTFVVPAGITSITVDAYGAKGGDAAGIGGLGGRATATFTVTPGETLNIYVGGRGVDGNAGGNGAGGYNGGGTGWQLAVGNGGSGGGGGTDIRRSPYGLLNDRIVVAGGGGGSENTGGGPMAGGVGGGLNGGDGQVWGGNTATGGTQVAGGAANTGLSCDGNLVPATNGALGLGGLGGRCTLTRCGGGGGGGWYGGGGVTRGNGSGGGSGYVNYPGNTNTSMVSGVQSGNGQLVINYTPPAPITTLIAGLASGSFFPLGTTLQTYQVTDYLGNTAQCSFNITVVDNQSPVISSVSNITVNNNPGVCGAIVNYVAPVGTDNCVATTTLTSGLGSGSLFPIGTSTEVYTATDASGNTASTSFTITVVDNEAPIFSCANMTVNNDAGVCGAVVNYIAPVATDNCAGVITNFVSGLGTGSLFPLGTTTEMYSATDASGVTSTCSFTVTVIDNELPLITSPANISSCVGIVNGIAPVSTSDNCVGISVSYNLSGATFGSGVNDASGNTFNVGTTLVTYYATDAAGNIGTSNFNVTINPTYQTPISMAICQGDSLMAGGAYQTTTGNYIDILTSVNGCDSTIYTSLTVNPNPIVLMNVFNEDTVCQGDDFIPAPIASPSGGFYSGTGVIGTTFNPSIAGLGSHYVVYTYTNANGCTSADSTMVTVVACTGVKGIKNELVIDVYPNPTLGQLTITLGSLSKSIEITVTELNGQLVKSGKYSNSKNVRMDISDLSDGMYFITVKADNELKQVKVVKN